jgi:hypothetical protein
MRDLPFQRGSPPPGWHIEASHLIKEKGCPVEIAVAAVVLRFLSFGDLDPLFDAVGRGYVHTPKVLKYVAAMLNSNYKNGHRIRYPIDIELRRQRGRPRRGEIRAWEHAALAIIKEGVQALAKGKDPGSGFWDHLKAALNPVFRPQVEQKHFPRMRDRWLEVCKTLPSGDLNLINLEPFFPLKGKVRRRRGRPYDPQLQARDRIVAENVRKRRLRGEKYGAAIAAAAKGGVSVWVARRAYDGDVKPKR